MFKQLLFLAVFIFIPPLSFADLTDQTFDTSIEENQLYILLQIQIRDSNQNLAGYIETDRIIVQNFEELSIILDDMSTNPENTEIVTINEKKYQIITGVGTGQYISDTTVSLSSITNDGKPLVYANLDGFPVRSGDIVISTWTLIRPA